MARTKSPTLTEAELRLMNVLWDVGAASVNDVVDALPPETPLAYNTVLTMLRILEQKGYIQHIKEGRAFIYRPLVNRDEARVSALRHLIGRFFDNSPELLALTLLKHESLGSDDLDRLKQMIEETPLHLPVNGEREESEA